MTHTLPELILDRLQTAYGLGTSADPSTHQEDFVALEYMTKEILDRMEKEQ